MSSPTKPETSWKDQCRRLGAGVVAAVAVALIVATIGLGVGLAQGYRPVVLTSGSMTPTAPTGSLVVAAPTESVDVGDILVMPDASRATVTHRVVEIETNSDGWLYAVTKGDANQEVDAAPYRLEGEQLVGRWILPGVGGLLLWLGNPLVGLVVIGTAVLVLTMTAISYIWRSGDEPGESAPRSGQPSSAGAAVLVQRKGRLGVASVLAILFGATGLAWSMYLGAESVPGNAFSLSDCFDARVKGVQSGQLVSTANGVTSQTITAVVPDAAFLTYSVRSNSSKPGDSVVLGNLSSASSVEFLRQTDSATPPPITIEWSVVEYSCGVRVQRGAGFGDGTSATDFTVDRVDPASSFVLGGSVAGGGEATFDLDDDTIVELVGDDTVRFRNKDALPVEIDRAIGFQLVTFADPGDLRTQVITTTIPNGVSTQSVPLPQSVAPDASLVLAHVGSIHGGGDIGERAIRARLLDATTVELHRQVSTTPVEVQIQVVTFFDGTIVESGVVDFASGESTQDVEVAPVDLARTTSMSTVIVGSGASGGSTNEAVSGEPGEAAVTVALPDASTVRLERAATDASASFSWQVVTWGGPTWADGNAPFRQRVDVEAASVDVPDGYTTPLTFDHAALVSSGLSSAGGDDLRLWSFDGATWTEIDRVLDENSTWNAAATTIWFRTRRSIDSLDVSSYWLYFGDPAPSPALDDPANVWLIDEGFEAGLGAFEDRTAGTSWYTADPWTRRIDLTIDADAVTGPLVDLPVLVTVSSADLASNAQSDASDIYFTDAGGARLAHDIESWVSSTGTLHAWVRMPSLSNSADTPLSLYYGAANAPDQRQARATWEQQGSVWTFDRDVSGAAPTLDDLGELNRDGAAIATVSRVGVPTGFAASLDGVSGRFETGDVRLTDTPLTVSAWFLADSLTGDAVLMAQGDPAASGLFELGVDATSAPGAPLASFTLRLDDGVVTTSGGALTAGTWHHVVAVWNQTSVELFVDGVLTGSSPAAGSLPLDRNGAIVIGGDAAGARTLAGDLANVRLRAEAIGAAEIAFEHQNLAAPTAVVSATAPTTGTFRAQGAWSIRRALSVSADLTDSDVADVPVLVELIDSGLATGAQADGGDFVFTASDGVTRLDHHIESWNSSTGALTAWVRLPLLSSATDTSLFLYLGNSGAADQSDPVAVWGPQADLVLTGP